MRRFGKFPTHPAAADALGAVLLDAADRVRGRTRAGEFAITSREQLDACSVITEWLTHLPVHDQGLRGRAADLAADVDAAAEWRWVHPVRSTAVVVLAIVLGVAAGILGGAGGSGSLLLLGAVLGGAAVAALVVVDRRPGWSLRGQPVSSAIVEPGL